MFAVGVKVLIYAAVMDMAPELFVVAVMANDEVLKYSVAYELPTEQELTVDQVQVPSLPYVAVAVVVNNVREVAVADR